MRPFIGVVFRFAVRGLLLVMVLPVLYLMEPFYRVRLGTMYTQRLGHLAVNAETFLRRLKMDGTPPRTFYLFFGYDPANRQLCEMWKRLEGFPVRFLESRWGMRILFAWKPILKHTRFWEAHGSTYTEYRLFNHTRPILSFTGDEERRGEEGLREMGIGKDDWFVLFHARDGKFLRAWRPELADVWKNTDFRNVGIENYFKAVEHITSLGGYALRFGAVVKNPIPDTENPRIIDYATKHRSDFMDVYLGARCRFFIGSSSGPEALANIFNVPLVAANHFPYNFTRYNRRSLIIPRVLTTVDGQRRVPYWEAKKAGYYVGGQPSSSIHNTMNLYAMLQSDPDDILDGVLDMIDQLEGREPTTVARELQDFYERLYLSHFLDHKDGARISPRFAERHRDLIVPPDGVQIF